MRSVLYFGLLRLHTLLCILCKSGKLDDRKRGNINFSLLTLFPQRIPEKRAKLCLAVSPSHVVQRKGASVKSEKESKDTLPSNLLSHVMARGFGQAEREKRSQAVGETLHHASCRARKVLRPLP